MVVAHADQSKPLAPAATVSYDAAVRVVRLVGFAAVVLVGLVLAVATATAVLPLPTNLTETRVLVGFFALVFSLFTLAAWVSLFRAAWRALTGAERAGRA